VFNPSPAARSRASAFADRLYGPAEIIDAAMASLSVLTFSSEDGGTCHRMSNDDAKVAEDLGLEFISVMLQDTDTYRRVLLAQCPGKEGMGWPTDLVVSQREEEFEIHGEWKGGLAQDDFRERPCAALPQG